MYLESIFFFLLIGVLFTLMVYSKGGDIDTLTGECPSIISLKKQYKTQQDIVDRLHKLFIYKTSYIRWNKFIVIAMFTAVIILSFLKQHSYTVTDVLLVSGIIFLAIDLPNRWGHAHIESSVIQEVTQLYSLYHTYDNTIIR